MHTVETDEWEYGNVLVLIHQMNVEGTIMFSYSLSTRDVSLDARGKELFVRYNRALEEAESSASRMLNTIEGENA